MSASILDTMKKVQQLIYSVNIFIVTLFFLIFIALIADANAEFHQLYLVAEIVYLTLLSLFVFVFTIAAFKAVKVVQVSMSHMVDNLHALNDQSRALKKLKLTSTLLSQYSGSRSHFPGHVPTVTFQISESTETTEDLHGISKSKSKSKTSKTSNTSQSKTGKHKNNKAKIINSKGKGKAKGKGRGIAHLRDSNELNETEKEKKDNYDDDNSSKRKCKSKGKGKGNEKGKEKIKNLALHQFIFVSVET